MKTIKGKVYLVGAGPGDPGLITEKGIRCIKKADVIIYDFLAAPEHLKFAGQNTELIYVGKQGGNHTLTQEKINALIVGKANKGLIVTRLKGGDPFIFGRGGEEVEKLVKNRIPFEIVPGVSSAIAAPAYAGIPLTHRKFTSTLAFVTGHEDPKKYKSSINWKALAKGIGTIVFLMGVKNLGHITTQLINNEMSPDTPVALIRWGTTNRQFTVSGTLKNIVKRVEKADLKPPAVIVVGDVVKLRELFHWFEDRPLMGKNIVVTRARAQASALASTLFELGANCFECPTIKVVATDNNTPLSMAVKNISSYKWLIFTSVNGVDFFFKQLFLEKDKSGKSKDVRILGHLKIAAIGPATAKKLMDFGLICDIVPESYIAESVVEAFTKENIEGAKILLPRAKKARFVLPEQLRKMGAVVDEVTAYCTVEDTDNAEILLEHLEAGEMDLITFTSSSTVENFKAIIPSDKFDQILKGVDVACIGPITADTARNLGFDVNITAKCYTIPGLCEAIENYYSDKKI